MIRRRLISAAQKLLGMPSYDATIEKLRADCWDRENRLFMLREDHRKQLDAHRAHSTMQSATIAAMRIYIERAARELGKDYEADAKKEGLI